MKVLKKIDVLIKAISNIPNLGFVPTMGGLHKGHISLIKESQKKCKKTLVSIYINPKQFNNKKDFISYPRNIEIDLKILKRLKVDYVFIPVADEIKNINVTNKITLKNSEKILCAKFRKGHFEGVLDIMDRFIKLINPKYVFMGEKDFQQLFLVKNYIKKKYKTLTYSCKTIRDKNKVALSSRNILLSKKDLNKVGIISAKLIKIKSNINKKYLNQNYLSSLKKELINKFGITIEYLEVRNEHDLKLMNTQKKYRIFISYYINKVRLIDNF